MRVHHEDARLLHLVAVPHEEVATGRQAQAKWILPRLQGTACFARMEIEDAKTPVLADQGSATAILGDSHPDTAVLAFESEQLAAGSPLADADIPLCCATENAAPRQSMEGRLGAGTLGGKSSQQSARRQVPGEYVEAITAYKGAAVRGK